MPSLTDIAASTKTVAGVPVFGVSAAGIAYLLNRFPVVRELFAGRDIQMDSAAISTLAPEVVAAVIACGCGNVNDEAAEASASKLGAGTQLEFLEAIVPLTMPDGVGPFVTRLEKIASGLHVESGKAPDTKSQQPSKG